MATNWQDRRPTYPNRYKVTMEDGSVQYITLERADEPTVEGTPINAENLNALEQTASEAKALAETAKTDVGSVLDKANNAMPKSGGTFSGTVWANGSNRTNECLRNISVKDTSVTGNYQSTNSIIMVRK